MRYALQSFLSTKSIPFLIFVLLFSAVGFCQEKDTTDTEPSYTMESEYASVIFPKEVDTLSIKEIRKLPYTYTGQMLDGREAGVSLLSTSGEPGIAPLTVLRGLSVPIGDYGDVYSNHPLIVIDGIPLIRNDHPYQLDVKKYAFQGIGSGIDISALIDINNIEDIKVFKGAKAVALFGPDAANGAILFSTRVPEQGKYKIGANIYGGIALPPVVNSDFSAYLINGSFERDFINPFYEKYASFNDQLNFPAYLQDSTRDLYFGPSNWTDLYYRVALQHGAGLNITGGSARARFRFGIGEHTENGVTDQTALKRYNVYYDMFIVPIKDLSIRTYVQAATASRNRNYSIRERFAEIEYFPDQQFPLSPNKKYLDKYYDFLDFGIDKNMVNSIQSMVNVKYDVSEKLSLNSRFTIDYNENHRNYFVPGAVNDDNSYNSYFSGINRRIKWNNYAEYNYTFSANSRLNVELGQSLEFNRRQYGYIRGYNSPNDFIKIIEVDNQNGEWLTHDKKWVFAYKDYLNENVVSFYGNADYTYKDRYKFILYLRSDGSSYFKNGYYWGISPVLSFDWDVKGESWLKNNSFFNSLHIVLTGGRTSRFPTGDYYGYGPHYTEDIGWKGSENVSTYSSFPTLGLPFTDGYVGGNIKMPYTDHWDIGVNTQVMDNWNLGVNLYSKTNRDLLIAVPTGGAEYGFSGQWLNGMDVRNSGVEVNLRKSFSFSSELKWTTGLIFQYNKNKLLSLPNDLHATTYGQRRLVVGKPTDQFWLLQNEGIYNNDSEVPVMNGKKLSYNGVPFQAGDPRWKDVNNDGVINDEDKVLQGHIMAPVHGGWNNIVTFKNWELGFSLLYSFGRNLINGAAANRFEFVSKENATDIESVKELTFWQVRANLNDYPKYNPWSLVDPYQSGQTLFYEKAGFVRLQSVTLQYDLTLLPLIKKSGIERLQFYITGSNLMTLSPYSGDNPSLGDYFGYNYNYMPPVPPTFTFGIHADF